MPRVRPGERNGGTDLEESGCELYGIGDRMRLMTLIARTRSYSLSVYRRSAIAGRVGLSAVLTVGCLALSFQPAVASTVERKSLSDLVKSAELVFEGDAVSSTVIPGPPGRPPHTCVMFKVTDVIAGQNPGGSLQLCFLGGEVDGERTVVSDLTYPTVGEHGIYIAESIHQAMVNPIAGWDQGRFLVEKDPVSGASRVLTAHRRPVLGMAAEARLPTVGMSILPAEGTAAGVMSGDGPDMKGAMTRDDFKTWLRSAR
jgi:hypothetical protein